MWHRIKISFSLFSVTFQKNQTIQDDLGSITSHCRSKGAHITQESNGNQAYSSSGAQYM